MVVKLNTFRIVPIDSTSMKWPLFGVLGHYSPKYCLIWMKFWPEVNSSKKKTVFENPSKILNFDSNGTHSKITVLVHFGAQFNTGKPKILLKTKDSAKTIFLGISSNQSPRPQKNHRILVELSKEKIFWIQIGSKLPPGAMLKGYQKFSHSI